MELTQNTTNYMTNGYSISKDSSVEEIIHIPYNINNILASEDNILELLATNNVIVEKINHIHFFQQAFTHKSYIQKDIFPEDVLIAAKNELGNPPKLLELGNASYERLEFFGDRVVKLVTSMYLFYRYPNEDEGFMTRLQTKIEDKTNLAVMSKKIGLGKYFIISQQIESLNGRNLEKIHEDVFEAFLGALFLSNGFEPCCVLLVNLLETLIDYSDKLYCDNNYKDILLRYYHKQKWVFPKYHMIYQEGPPHKRTYIMGVEKGTDAPINESSFKDRCVGFGMGASKKEGQQNAAKMALILYGYLKEDQYKNSDIFYPNWEKINLSDSNSNYIYQANDNDSTSEQLEKNTTEKNTTDNNSYYSDVSEETDSD
jgi:ribonuclease III|uniref:RNase III domain-containing protein n=1 Tax=viral metagenome TaxID=1070528 RepID=A0A6C0IVB5_9ZZZZ